MPAPRGLSAVASLIALAAFVLGAVSGGRIGARSPQHRGRHLRNATGAMVPLLLLALLLAAVVGQPIARGGRYAITATLALAMGIQNATARRLAVPDLTTTVLTVTLTGIGADSHPARGPGGHVTRRLIAVITMLAGGLIGALLVIHVDLGLPLALACTVATLTALVAHRVSGRSDDWARSPGQS